MNIVRVEADGHGGLDVGDAVGEGEGDLLGGRAAGLADVVAGDGDRVPERQVLGAVGEGVGHQAHRRAGREDVGAAGGVLLEDVVLDGAAEFGRVGAALLGHDLVEEEQQGCGRVDRHRGGDDGLVDAVHQAAHVVQRRDGDTGAPDLAEGAGIVRIEAELRGQVEGDAQAGLTAGKQQPVPLVALLGGGHPGVLAHGPAAAPVHRRVDAAGVGKDTGIGQIPGASPGAR